MVDEVEISNVGGPNGVASEATLAALVKALNNNNNDAARSIRLETLARQASSKALSGESTLLGKAFRTVADPIGGFVSQLVGGSGRLSDFTDAILGTNNILTKSFSVFAHFVDDNVDSLRDLSSVGASFNNSIFDMRTAATASAMTFTEFAELVKENSALLARLGGTTSSGARAFGEFSKSVRTSRVGKELMGMGFTISEINEGLTSYLDLQLRSGREINLRDKNLSKASQEYLFHLDRLAKLTGKQREQIADDMAKQIQDAGVRRQLNALTGEQQANLRGTLQFMDEMMPGLAGGFRDLMDGVAQTDLGIALATQIPDLQPLLEDVFAGNISETEFIEELKKFGPEIAAIQSQFSKEQLDAMRNAGGLTSVIAEMVDSLQELNSVTQMNTAELDKEAKQRSKLTELFGSFEQIVLEARTAITDAFLNSAAFDALKAFGSSLADSFQKLFGEGGGLANRASEGFQSLTSTLIGSEGIITGWIRSLQTLLDDFNKYIDDGGNPMQFWKEKIGELATDIKNWFSELFTNFWESSTVQNGVDTFFNKMEQMFSKLLEMFGNLIREQFGGVAGSELSQNKLEGYYTRLKAGEELSSEETEDFMNTLRSLERSRILEEKGSGFLGWRKGANFLGEASGFTSDLFNASSWFADREDLISAYESRIPQRRIGTFQATGKMSEPSDMVAKIHSGERVLNPVETAEYNSSKNSQTELLRKVDQLNTTMMTVARILESGLDVQTKTMRNLKTVNGDFMKGIGR